MPGYIKRFFGLEPIEIGETGRKAIFLSRKKKGDVDAFSKSLEFLNQRNFEETKFSLVFETRVFLPTAPYVFEFSKS